MSAPSSAARQGRAGRLAMIAGFTLAFASGWNVANVGAVASSTAHAYGITLATVGLFTTALFVTHTGSQVPGGRAVDRFGAARTGTIGLCLIACGDLIALITPDISLALAGRAVTGIGTGTAFIAGAVIVREARGTGLAQGVFGGVAMGAGGLAVATVPQLNGWRAPYWTSLALVGIGAAGLLLTRHTRQGTRIAHQHRTSVRGVLADIRLYRLGLLYSCSYGVTLVLGNWITEYLHRQSSLSNGTAAIVGSLTLLVSIVSRPLGGWILNKHPAGIRAAVTASVACGLAGTLALLLAQPAALTVVGAILVGIGGGISFAPVFVGAALTQPRAPAASIGMVNGIANLMVLFGTPLAGLTFQMSGGGRIAFVGAAACWLIALLFIPDRATLGAR